MSSLYRMLHLDYHQPPWMLRVAEAIDNTEASRLARMFKEAGVQAVEIFAYDHYGQAFFPSAIGVNHPNLANDYTGLMTNALKLEGIKVILYMNVYTSVHLHKLHPEWFIRNIDGSYPMGAWLQHEASHICASSPYLEEYFVPMLQEVIRRYKPDAIWLDAGCWMIETLCYCDNCQKKFREATGYDLPRGPMPSPAEELDQPVWLAWRLWRRGQIYDYLKTVVRAAKAVDPEILVTDNNLGRFSTGIPYVENGKLVKWLTPAEIGVDYLSCDPVPMGGNHELILSIEGRYQWTTGLPFNYMFERFNGWGEWQFRSPTDWKLEAATIVANGGRCCFADQPYPDGTLESKVYSDLKHVYDWIKTFEPYLIEAEPVDDIAILASLASLQLGPCGGAEWGRRLLLWGQPFYENSTGLPGMGSVRTARIRGAHLAFVEGGIQALIYDEATLCSRLAEQSAVVVPEQCLLEKATIDALYNYVYNGGRLLITGRSGLWNNSGQRYSTDPLTDLLGLERRGLLPAPIHYLRMNRQRFGEKLDDVPIQFWGQRLK